MPFRESFLLRPCLRRPHRCAGYARDARSRLAQGVVQIAISQCSARVAVLQKVLDRMRQVIAARAYQYADVVGLVTRCRSCVAHAQSLSRNLHGADILVGVLDSRDTAATNQQVFLEDCPVRWIEPIHDERFGDLAQIGRTMVAVGEHGSILCRSGPDINRTGCAAGPVPARGPVKERIRSGPNETYVPACRSLP
jgi:hypothetical protein